MRWVVVEYSRISNKELRRYFYKTEDEAIKEFNNSREAFKFAGSRGTPYLGYPFKEDV